jgi:hypothetical protein
MPRAAVYGHNKQRAPKAATVPIVRNVVRRPPTASISTCWQRCVHSSRIFLRRERSLESSGITIMVPMLTTKCAATGAHCDWQRKNSSPSTKPKAPVEAILASDRVCANPNATLVVTSAPLSSNHDVPKSTPHEPTYRRRSRRRSAALEGADCVDTLTGDCQATRWGSRAQSHSPQGRRCPGPRYMATTNRGRRKLPAATVPIVRNVVRCPAAASISTYWSSDM